MNFYIKTYEGFLSHLKGKSIDQIKKSVDKNIPFSDVVRKVYNLYESGNNEYTLDELNELKLINRYNVYAIEIFGNDMLGEIDIFSCLISDLNINNIKDNIYKSIKDYYINEYDDFIHNRYDFNPPTFDEEYGYTLKELKNDLNNDITYEELRKYILESDDEITLLLYYKKDGKIHTLFDDNDKILDI